jgi:hypothetical protein
MYGIAVYKGHSTLILGISDGKYLINLGGYMWVDQGELQDVTLRSKYKHLIQKEFVPMTIPVKIPISPEKAKALQAYKRNS